MLAGLVTEQTLDDESLRTFMCLAEGIINNRPLTSVSTDPTDLSALTPNHFLQLRPAESVDGSFTEACLRRRWRQIEYLASVFWRRWTREYLPKLQQRTKWVRERRDISVGDLVLIIDHSLQRNEWPLGRVTEVTSADDGHVRSCKIQTKNSVCERPIRKICLLEAAEVPTQQNDKTARPSPSAEE